MVTDSGPGWNFAAMVVLALAAVEAAAAVTTNESLGLFLARPRHPEGTSELSVLACAYLELAPLRVAVGHRRPTVVIAAVAVAAVADGHSHCHHQVRSRGQPLTAVSILRLPY